MEGYRWALQGEPTASWQDKPLASVTDKDVVQAVKLLEGKRQFASARLLRSYLHKFFKWSVSERKIDRNPASDIPLASVPSDFNRNRVLTIGELQEILSAAAEIGGTFVHTEDSHKWTREGFAALLRDAGFGRVAHWTDAQGWYAAFVAHA